MRRVVLRIYDFMSCHKAVAAVILVLVLGACAFGALRLHYNEDVSAFLPMDGQSRKYSEVYEKLGGQDKIAFIFSGSVEDTLRMAMSAFASCWRENDRDTLVDVEVPVASSSSVSDVYDFISSHIPLFLQEDDYARMDSLLNDPGYVSRRMEVVRKAMYMPSFMTKHYRSDPLDLFSPVYERLSELKPSGAGRSEDGLLFTPDGRCGIIFLTSPAGGTESGLNARITCMADKVAGALEADYPGVEVMVTGGPVVAVENASRIKKDSALALGLAVILICLLLFFSYRRFADVLYIFLSIGCGALLSLGIISLFKTEISLIILGIGSIIIGIAVNYPLHYIDHLKFCPDKRKALGEQALPLVVGNVTTVGAFLSLLLMKSEALRDFGFIGAMLLVGTIVFVLVFLPVFFPLAKRQRKTLRLDLGISRTLKPGVRTAAIIAFAGITVALWLCGRKVGFDSDLHNINYMTREQESGFALLNEFGGEGERIFLVTGAEDADSLFAHNEDLCARVRNAGLSPVSMCDFLPSSGTQMKALARWRDFLSRHPDLCAGLQAAAAGSGFTAKAFAPFQSILTQEYELLEAEDFAPLLSTVGQAMYLEDEDGFCTMVNYLFAREDEAEAVKDAVRGIVDGDSFCFSSSDVSGKLAAALSEDFDMVGTVCSLLVFILLCISLGSAELGIMAFVPLAVSWIWILGIMGIAGWQFNVVNVILASFIFGQGDDYTIFMTEGLVYEYATGRKILHSFKNSVTLSALLMFIGIGVLIMARHPAMRSLGQVTVVGMLVVVLMARCLPPVIFRFLTEKKGRLREIPVTFLRIVDTVWVLLIFVAAMLVFTVAAAVFFIFSGRTERSRLLYHKAICSVSRLSLRCIPGVKHTLRNTSGEDFSKPAVLVCNHQSHLDVLALLALTPKLVILTNDWVWHNPFYGFLIRRAEFYPVSDGFETNASRLKSLIDKGYSVAVFPEGTRSVDCAVLRFHPGAAKLARELDLDILPVYIHGFGKVLPKKEMMLRRLPLYTEIGKRITVPGDDALSFTRSLRHLYVNEYSRICREREDWSFAAYYVRHQYLYKGREAMRECRSVLKHWTPAELDSLCLGKSVVVVENAGYGSLPLLLALSHPDIEVHSFEPDEDKYAVASHCSAIPPNLQIFVFTRVARVNTKIDKQEVR